MTGEEMTSLGIGETSIELIMVMRPDDSAILEFIFNPLNFMVCKSHRNKAG